jgi:hypothetical protein
MDEDRIVIWPTLSPRGHDYHGLAHYLTWPGWERFRVEKLGEAETGGSLIPLHIDEPEGFPAALAALAEAARDAASPSSRPPLFDVQTGALRGEILAGGRPAAPGKGANLDHLLLALWSAADSQRREAEAILAKALSSRQSLLAALAGEDQEDDEGAQVQVPPPPEPPLWAARAFLRLAAPVLRPGDLLWSPWPGLGEATGLEFVDPFVSLPPS